MDFLCLEVWRKLIAVPGLYVHIPFCARRCPYCDFAVSVNRRDDFRAAYVAALRLELHNELSKVETPIETVFFGGGTPTELSAATLNHILADASSKLISNAEISLEGNPENLGFEYLAELRNGDWNRLSLGAQSFDEGELAMLGRAHGPQQIETVIRDAKRAGWNNISLDLIYGTPGTDLKSWQSTLRRAIDMGVTHISAYSLTVETGTAFGQKVAKRQLVAPDNDFLGDLMDEAATLLGDAGFERYEVSNWAMPGFECRHNQNYWRGGDYLGVGCGAHGHLSGHRFWNERDSKTYIRKIESGGTARAGDEILSPRERATELVALGLRSREGFSLEEVSKLGEFDARRAMNGTLASFVNQGALLESGGRVIPSQSALAIADGLATRLVSQF